MKTLDMRFDKLLLKSWISQEFVKYQCDTFDFTNSVTQIVGLFIGDSVYELTNVQKNVDYFGFNDDISIYSIEPSRQSKIKSAFKETEQITTPIKGIISNIKLINENQILECPTEIYDIWLTRAIIFEVDNREISFEKDIVPFSEEIIIRRGYNLIDKLADQKEFLTGWDEKMKPQCKREVIKITS